MRIVRNKMLELTTIVRKIIYDLELLYCELIVIDSNCD